MSEGLRTQLQMSRLKVGGKKFAKPVTKVKEGKAMKGGKAKEEDKTVYKHLLRYHTYELRWSNSGTFSSIHLNIRPLFVTNSNY